MAFHYEIRTTESQLTDTTTAIWTLHLSSEFYIIIVLWENALRTVTDDNNSKERETTALDFVDSA